MQIVILTFLIMLFATFSASAQIAEPTPQVQTYEMVPADRIKSVEQLEAELLAALDSLIELEPIAEFSTEEFGEFQDLTTEAIAVRNIIIYRAKLRQQRNALSERASATPDDPSLVEELHIATGKLNEANQSAEMKLLKLQNLIQEQNRKVNMVSKVLNGRHDTAKAAINNLRS